MTLYTVEDVAKRLRLATEVYILQSHQYFAMPEYDLVCDDLRGPEVTNKLLGSGPSKPKRSLKRRKRSTKGLRHS